MRALLLAGLLCACGPADGPAASTGPLEGGAPRPVGLLGLVVAPSTRTVSFVGGDDEEHHTGGLLVRAVLDGSPLASELEAGDVLVGVGEDDLPNRADPTLDLVRLVEEAHSGGRRPIPLGVLRGARWRSVDLRLPGDLAPIEVGAPAAIERFQPMARRALARLVALQFDDGSFPCAADEPACKVAVTAAAALALRAGGAAEPEHELTRAYARALHYVRTAVDDGECPLDPWSAAFATWLAAEELAGHALPDGEAAIVLGAALAHLVELREPEGAWPPTGAVGPSERTLTTNVALLALATARRAGAQVEGGVLEGALAQLKLHTHGGRPVRGVPAGLDRRSEAGRAAGGAAALRALGCPGSDPFLDGLEDLVERYGAELGEAPAVPELHLFFQAVHARQRGGGTWDTFVSNTRARLVALQAPDGTFLAWPREVELPFERALGGDAWRTALGALTLLVQEERLPLTLARRRHPLAPDLDSDGTPLEAGAQGFPPGLDPGNLPPGAQVIPIDDPAQLQELLERMGVEGDATEIITVTDDEDDG